MTVAVLVLLGLCLLWLRRGRRASERLLGAPLRTPGVLLRCAQGALTINI